jgi:acyl-CoA thioesterase FadM
MNLWLRLLWVLVSATTRRALPAPFGVSQRRFHVLPNDIDAMLHMNNGRYLTVMDLGRVDLMIRTGLFRLVVRNGWTPIVGTATISFRREMRLLQAYLLETRIAGWNGQLAIMEQKFFLASGPRASEVAAIGLVRVGLYDRARHSFVPPTEIMEALGVAAESPPLAPEMTALVELEDKLRRAGSPSVSQPSG